MKKVTNKVVGRRANIASIMNIDKSQTALRRLENDDYGYCQECGDEIAPARLAVDPTVLLCIRCAEASETR
jgi:RNA polymerase-binding transcription factor DksA